MRIKIRLNESRFDLNVKGNTTIRELKQILSSRISRDCSDYLFCHEQYGEPMHDYETLDYYDIDDGETIFVAPPVIGGGPPIVNETYSSNINCVDKRGKIGEYYGYKIKGSEEGTVWGDGIYTDDSNIAKAAVLEGKCKLGEEKVICIKIIEGKSSYSSCSKNGLSSISYGYWDGSYIIY